MNKGKTMIDSYEHSGKDLLRLVALSDGIFAIVLTLLVLELKLPEVFAATNGDLLRALAEQSPKLIGYVQSFLVIGLYWVAHHWDLEHIKHYDRTLLWINLMFLLCISLLPFTTALVSEHGNLTLGWGIYAANMALVGVMLCLLWSYAASRHYIDPEILPRLSRYVTVRHLILPAIFILSIGLANINSLLAQVSPLLSFPVQFAIERTWLKPIRHNHDETTHPNRNIVLWRIATLLPVIVILGWLLWAR